MKFFLSFFLFLFIGNFCKSFAQTTLEEYNYITKGYKIQIESGLDMKRGYELEKVRIVSSYNRANNNSFRRIEVKKLVYVGSYSKRIAAYMLICERVDYDTYAKKDKSPEIEYYLCLPHPSSDDQIQNLWAKQLTELDTKSYFGNDYKDIIIRLLSYQISWN